MLVYHYNITISSLLFICFARFSLARPPYYTPPAASSLWYRRGLTLLADPYVLIANSTAVQGGEIEVYDPSTDIVIPQGAATDGGGYDFSLPAILWIAFSLAVGVPLALAGIRGWRFTTGAAIGLSLAVCSWAGLVNTVDAPGIPDILIILIVFGFAFLGFIFGLFEIGRLAGIVCLGTLSGFAFSIRLILLREGLLIHQSDTVALNWVVITVFALANGVFIIFKQRIGLTMGSASVGTFLSVLGVDLIVNKQSGMSSGLRFLFDRNPAHIVYILENGYNPPILTQALIAVSIAVTPILAYAQHRMFPRPFSRKPRQDEEIVESVHSTEETELLKADQARLSAEPGVNASAEKSPLPVTDKDLGKEGLGTKTYLESVHSVDEVEPLRKLHFRISNEKEPPSPISPLTPS